MSQIPAVAKIIPEPYRRQLIDAGIDALEKRTLESFNQLDRIIGKIQHELPQLFRQDWHL